MKITFSNMRDIVSIKSQQYGTYSHFAKVDMTIKRLFSKPETVTIDVASQSSMLDWQALNCNVELSLAARVKLSNLLEQKQLESKLQKIRG